VYSLPGIIMRGCHALISADSVDLGAQSDRICTPISLLKPRLLSRAERRVGARLSRAQDVVDRVAVPRHSPADSRPGCIFIHRRLRRELTILPLVGRYAPSALCRGKGIYSGLVLDLSSLDLEEIANALADHTDYEHRWLINPQSGEIAFSTADTGIDGQTPVDLGELDLVCIDPPPSWVWYQDMADFAEAITDGQAGRRLLRAIQGKGAFRRFKDELHDEYPDLLPAWYAFRDARAQRRAVQWLADSSLIDDDAAASRYLTGHPDPDLP
jgi:hypothetical protein